MVETSLIFSRTEKQQKRVGCVGWDGFGVGTAVLVGTGDLENYGC